MAFLRGPEYLAHLAPATVLQPGLAFYHSSPRGHCDRYAQDPGAYAKDDRDPDVAIVIKGPPDGEYALHGYDCCEPLWLLLGFSMF